MRLNYMQIKYIIYLKLLLLFVLQNITGTNQISERKISDTHQVEIHSYKIKGSVSELFLSKTLMINFCYRVLRDLIADLKESKIKNPEKLKEYYISISIINMIKGNDKKSLEFIKKIRAIEKKKENQFMSGLTSQVLIESRYGQKNLSSILFNKLISYPWPNISKRVLAEKKDLEYRTRGLILKVIETQFDPAVKKSEFISLNIAHQIIRLYHCINFVLPHKKGLLKAYFKIIKEKNNVIN